MSIPDELDVLFKSVTSFSELVKKRKKECQQSLNELKKMLPTAKAGIGAIVANV